MSGTVLAGAEKMELGRRGRRGNLGHEIAQCCGRRNGRKGLEERAAFERHGLMVRANSAAEKRESERF